MIKDWIKVEDRLPEKGVPVLVLVKNIDLHGDSVNHVEVSIYCCMGVWKLLRNDGFAPKAIMWQPLPDYPLY